MSSGESKFDKKVIADEKAAEVAYQADKTVPDKAAPKAIPKTTPYTLPTTFLTRVEFDAAVANPQSDESITLNGVKMRISSGPWVHYYTHSPNGVINTTPPND